MEEIENLSENGLEVEMNDEAVNDSDDNADYEETIEEGWIPWFIRQDGNEFLIEVPQDFIKDRTNLYGIQKHFKDIE